MQWCSIFPLHNFALQAKDPVAFAAGLRLTPLPAWLRLDRFIQQLGTGDRRALDEARLGFTAEYEAAALGDPDPQWQGTRPHSIQETKYEMAVLANLSLWLSRPSPACFTLAIHAPRSGDQWAVQQWEKHTPMLCHPQDANVVLTPEDVDRAARLHGKLATVGRNNVVWTAILSTWLALQMNMENVRYLLLWVALEALFGPEDAREMTYRLAQRLSLFLAPNRPAARDLFVRAKNGYALRSRVAHGRWREHSGGEQAMATAEAFLRDALTRILSDDSLTARFLGKDREQYLDALIFE